MSVAQHIRDRAGRFRWMGLLVVWAVFIVMAAVLLIERAGVQYSACLLYTSPSPRDA